MRKILTLLTLFLVIVSCANPTVVNVIGPNDSKMNCKELSAEILKANKYALFEAHKFSKKNRKNLITSELYFSFYQVMELH